MYPAEASGRGLGSKGDLAAMQNSEHQGAGLAMCGEPGFVLEVEPLGIGKKERWQV